MRSYTRSFRMQENFPVAIDEEWTVTDRGRVAERWRVISKSVARFTVEVTEYIPEGS
jgi:hypothetical protein